VSRKHHRYEYFVLGRVVDFLRYGEVEFGEDFFHVFPDPFSVFCGIISEQISWVVCGHEFYRGFSEAKVVFMELSSELSDWFVCFEKGFCGVCAKGDNNFRIYDFNLSLKIWEAAYYFFRSWVAIIRGSAFEDIADVDVGSF